MAKKDILEGVKAGVHLVAASPAMMLKFSLVISWIIAAVQVLFGKGEFISVFAFNTVVIFAVIYLVLGVTYLSVLSTEMFEKHAPEQLKDIVTVIALAIFKVFSRVNTFIACVILVTLVVIYLIIN